ncbi:Glutamyl-tRNA(Gln) amidotransferase A subunit [Penicillium alfredii]|uniref:Glutamyl-tRNA(Gln) amidotransferase subunit A, mitochondrial n=1 Tax=Penicillium alfredii TaxID=1506179 RepID=A0A9W9KDW2_9EURO|nr:Glutamyl-tRNA(Gln) amidotransferase A subunit [Penicillium alfredii]KAJ5101447.1 Glutamyl-tRNA(Gln) amidotransferase A subunit [Penicillium alfredii]
MSLLREAERCIANHIPSLNAFITPLRAGQWLDRVREADRRKEQGKPTSAVDGRLIAIKDNICTRDVPTTCGSGTLDHFTSPFNATVVEQLEAAGAVIAGKTNLDEFGMGSHSVHSHFGPVKNSRCHRSGQDLSAGGSSGGSAVAVAADQCYVALGTDTGGSVRLPAAYTGTVGFKPSYGLISRWGVVAYANSLDTVGILGRNTASVRDIFAILNQHDARDPTSLSPSSRSRITSHIQAPPLASRLSSSPIRIGVPIEYNISELSPSVRHAWLLTLSHLREQGHTIHTVSLPATKHALSAYYVLAPAEASSNLAKYDGVRYGTRTEGPDSDRRPDGYLYANTRGNGFGPEVQRRILLGTYSLSADAMDNYFIQAQRVRRLVQQDFNAVFAAQHLLATAQAQDAKGRQELADVDVLICPTAPSPPPLLSKLGSSPLDAYVNDVFTVPASLAGLPAISVPVTVTGTTQDADADAAEVVGIQVLGQYGDDMLVMQVGELLEGKKLDASCLHQAH